MTSAFYFLSTDIEKIFSEYLFHLFFHYKYHSVSCDGIKQLLFIWKLYL